MQIQLDVLERTGDWTLPHPLPIVDPEGDAFPLHGATEYSDGFTLYGKHPALIYLYRPLHDAFGTAGWWRSPSPARWRRRSWRGLVAERFRRGSGPLAALARRAPAAPCCSTPSWCTPTRWRRPTAALAAWAAIRVAGGPPRRLVGPPWPSRRPWPPRSCAPRARSTPPPWASPPWGSGCTGAGSAVAVLGGAVGLAGAAAVLVDRWWSDAVAVGHLRGWRRRRPAAAPPTSRVASAASAYTLVMPGYRGVTPVEAITAVGALLADPRRARSCTGGPRTRARRSPLPVAGAAILVVRSLLEWGPIPGLSGRVLAWASPGCWSRKRIAPRGGLACAWRWRPSLLFGFAVGGHPVRERRAHGVGRALLRPRRAPRSARVAAPALREAWAGWDRRRVAGRAGRAAGRRRSASRSCR